MRFKSISPRLLLSLLLPLIAAAPAFAAEFEVLDKLAVTGSAVLKSSVTVNGMAAPAVSPAGAATIYFDSTANKLRVSQNAGNYVNLVATGTANRLARFNGNTTPNFLDSLLSDDGANVSIGTVFQLSSAGDLVKIKNIGYAWPGSQGGADTYLRNDGAGALTWQAVTAGAGDNLGTHIATQTLNMAAFDIVGVSTLTVSSITTTAAGVTFSTNVFVMKGNVGIGTADPLYKLHVNGTSRITGAAAFDGQTLVLNDFGITAGQKLYLDGISNTYLSEIAADQINIVTAGSERVRIDGAGNVGIGAVPGSRLEVAGGSVTFHGSDSNPAIAGFTDAGGNYRMVISTSGNVGIGTAGPGQKLDVAGVAQLGSDQTDYIHVRGGGGTGRVEAVGGNTNVNLALSTKGTGSTYFWRGGYGGTASMFIDGTNGNVGIGVTDPRVILQAGSANNRIGAEPRTDGMDIGGILATNSSRVGGFYNTNPIPSAAVHFGAQGAGGQQGGIAFLTKALDDDTTQPAARMVITNAGSVGIGTTGPLSKTHVFDSGTAVVAAASDAAGTLIVEGPNRVFNTAGNPTNLSVVSNSAIAAGAGGTIGLGGKYNVDSWAQFGFIKAGKSNGTAGDFGGYLAFGSRTNGQDVAERMRIDSSGNVGIGTLGPAYKLDVNGDVQAANFRGNGSFLTGITGATGGISNPVNTNIVADNDNNGSGQITFTTGVTDKMVILNNGNVGIGTASPGAKLHIANTVPESTILVSNDARYWKFGTWDFGTGADDFFIEDKGATGADSNMRLVIDTSGNVGIGTTNPGSQLVATKGGNTFTWVDVGPYLSVSDGTRNIGMGALASGGWIGSTTNDGLSFRTNNTIKMTIDATGNVGISTRAPQARLDVLAAGSAATDMATIWRNSGGTIISSVSATGVMMASKFIGDGSSLTGIGGALSGGQAPKLPYWTAANTLGNSTLSQDSAGSLTAVNSTFTVQGSAFSVGGSTLVVKDGNVGIGTASPATQLNIVNSAAGNVVASQRMSNGVANLTTYITGQSYNTDVGLFDIPTSANPNYVALFASGGEDMYVGNYANKGLKFGTNNLTRMTILDSGNVGIGTTAPGYKLAINGSAQIMSGESLNFQNVAGNGNSVIANTGAGTNKELRFDTGVSGAIFIQNSGNVGIGTTGPSEKLDVNGTGNFATGVSIAGGSASSGAPKISALAAGTAIGAGFTTNAAGQALTLSNFFDADSLALRTGTAGGSNGIQIGGVSSTLGQTIQFITANAEQMRIASTGNVGVGTTNPTLGKLQIYQATDPGTTPSALHIALQGVGGGAATPQYGIKVDASASYNNSTSLYGVYSLASQNTGLPTYALWGETNPGASNTARYGVAGKSNFNSDAVHGLTNGTLPVGVYGEAFNSIGSANLSSSAAGYFLNSSTLGAESYGVYIKTTAGPTSIIPLRIDHASSELMRITSGGNVGIGTAAPGYKLEVNGNISFGSNGYLVGDGGNSYFGDGATLISGAATTDTGILTTGNIVFGTNAGAGNYERMRIASSGNVGIGTTETSLFNAVGGTTKLAVTGSSASTDILGNTDASLSIINTDDTANNTAGLHFAWQDTDGTPNFAAASIVAKLGAKVANQYPAGELAFLTSNATNLAPSEKVRITSAGDVGIGTASPGAKLDVTGNINATQWIRGGCVNPADANDIMVAVGPWCVDKYEASVWSTATGGTQYGGASDNYLCNDNGQDCAVGATYPIYARSVSGVAPSDEITWFQANMACFNAGKELLPNAVWQAAAAGTADPGSTGSGTNCNVNGGAKENTGGATGCVSTWGAEDMIGNVWEWVAEWGTAGSGASGSMGAMVEVDGTGTGYNNDGQWNIGGNSYTNYAAPAGWIAGQIPAVLRGGCWGNGADAGVFAFYATNAPSSWAGYVGFRCGRRR